MELKAYGYNVIHVPKGHQALSAMKQKDTLIDLILMDINLGEEKDGTKIAEMILLHSCLVMLQETEGVCYNVANVTRKSYTPFQLQLFIFS